MKIVFLLIDYVPHQIVTINGLIQKFNAEVYGFNLQNDESTPKHIDRLHTYRVRDFSKKELIQQIFSIKPDMIVIAGWHVKEFVWAAKKVRMRLNVPSVVYSDTQWRGTLRQKINRLLAPVHLKRAFTHIWVAGLYQFEYARQLGFKKNEIIFNALSCDAELFNKVDIKSKRVKYPKNFLFIGRFVELKGLKNLVNAWNLINDKKGWTLTLIGDGKLKNEIKKCDDIIIRDFMDQQNLVVEMQNSGCFILPSLFEQWSLVIHEAATAGLPIIATDVCGASHHFIINNFNGYKIKSDNVDSIKQSMQKIIESDPELLINFSLNSKILARTITPELGSANLMSILN